MLKEGDLIASRYRLESLIGEGGMASVWRAEDLTLRRPVAIKLLYIRGQRDPSAVIDQFLREARIAASVQHRNVIHTVDFGTAEGDMPYMVMELLTGESLAERMQRDPPLHMAEVVHIASLTLRGLAAVHEAGIVHRDLKPQNIFLHRDTDTVYPKILDFGISRSLGSDHQRPSAISTQDGMIVGTPDYMSPEQARGERDVDKRADIYSMGAIIYEGVTGRLPFDAETVGDLIVQIVTMTPKPMRQVRPDVPRVLSDCIEQAMAHDREHRFIDAQVFRRALLTAAEAAFPGPDAMQASEAPARGSAQRRFDASEPTGSRASPVPAAPRAAPPAAWGDFEGLDGRAGRLSPPATSEREPSSPRVPLAAAPQPPAARPAAAGREPARKPPAAEAAKSQNLAAPDQSLLGNSPFDAFGELGSGGLDLDYGGATPPPRSAARPGPQRPMQRVRKNGAGAAPTRSAARARQRPRPSLLWIVPALLALFLCVVLFAPALISEAPPVAKLSGGADANARAGAGPGRHFEVTRRASVGSRPAALRDVGF